MENSDSRTKRAHGCWLSHLECHHLLFKLRVRANVQTVSWGKGTQGMSVEKHCCSHSTGTAEAAMRTRSHCSLCLGMLPLRLRHNNSFSLSLECMAFLWRWVPVSTGCVGASYNEELLYPWLCSLYSSSHWKGKNVSVQVADLETWTQLGNLCMSRQSSTWSTYASAKQCLKTLKSIVSQWSRPDKTIQPAFQKGEHLYFIYCHLIVLIAQRIY